MIIARAPFRISFFGGGTDYPEFFKQHGGATLLTAIDQYCYISIHHLTSFFQHRFRASYAKTESVQHPTEFHHPLIRETLLQMDITEGLEISHVADMPGRTGLGSSSSFTVALLHALHTLKNETVTPAQLATEAIHIERIRVGDAGGHQDQYAAAYGGFKRLDFHQNGQVSVRPVTAPECHIQALQQHLVMFYTGVEQSAENILREQRNRTGQNLAALKTMLGMVNTAEELLHAGRISDIGTLLHESWQLKKNLSNGISNGLIDGAYDAACKAGARGGKMLGAGGRGFLLLLAAPEKHAAIRHQLSQLREVNFKFSDQGSRIIFTDTTP